MVSIVFPLLSIGPTDATSSRNAEVAASFEKDVWLSFPFPYRLPTTNPGGRRINIGRDRH